MGIRSLIAGKPLTWLSLEDIRVIADDMVPTIQGLPLAAKLSLHVTYGQFSEAGLGELREAVSSVHVSVARSYYSLF